MTKEQEEWLVGELMASMKMAEAEEPTARRYVRRVADRILIYCHRDDLPEQLLNTAVQMAEDMMRADLVTDSGGQRVASITRGDTSITYQDDSGSQQQAAAFLKNYEQSLNHFKKMNLPKDAGR